MISLNGSFCEGGGSIVRVALSLSALLRKPFEIINIRKNRPNPGLKSQHLFCIKALEELTGAKSEGAVIGSSALKYWPGKIQKNTVNTDIGTAGSISLLLQSLLLPCLFSGRSIRLKIKGGTDTKWAMPFDYFSNVLLPQLRKYGDIEPRLIERGYYPKGGGKIDIKIKPRYRINNKEDIPKISLANQGKLMHIKGISHASEELQEKNVAERQAKAAKLFLSRLGCPVNIQIQYTKTLSTGSGIVLWAFFSNSDEIDFNSPIILGADALGEKGKRSEEVGREAAERLIKEAESKAPVDSHLADSLIPFLALFGGKIKASEITKHTLTNIYVCEQFLGKCFEIDKHDKIIKSLL